MESENRGYVVNYYTTANGTKLTRDELSDRILKLLDGGGMTCGNIARSLKLTKQSIYNVMNYMMQKHFVVKSKGEENVFIYSKVKECLLADLLYPKAEEIEDLFIIKGRMTKYASEFKDRRSGTKRNDFAYSNHYLNSVYYGD